MEEFWQIVAVFLLSSIKFAMGGVPLAIGVYHFPFFKAVVVTSIGGMTGVYCFLYLFERIIIQWQKWFPKKKPDPRKKKFTWRNKMIVKIKRRFGLLGLSILTPTLLSIPLGIFLALRYYKNKKQILIYMVTTVFLTSILICSVKVFDLFD